MKAETPAQEPGPEAAPFTTRSWCLKLRSETCIYLRRNQSCKIRKKKKKKQHPSNISTSFNEFNCSCFVAKSCLLQPYGLSPPGFSVHWISQEICWSGCHCLLLGTLPIQGWDLCLLLGGRSFTSEPPGKFLEFSYNIWNLECLPPTSISKSHWNDTKMIRNLQY